MVQKITCINWNSHILEDCGKKSKFENSVIRMYNQASNKILLTYQVGWHKILVFRKLVVHIFAKKLKSLSLLNYIEIHSVVAIFPFYCWVSCIFLPTYLPYVSCRTWSLCCIKKIKVTLNESAQMLLWIHTNNLW